MKNKKILISIFLLIITTLLLMGVTYAYYRTRVIGNKSDESISVTSKTMSITYSDNNAAVITGTEINPGYIASKTFSVTNNGTGDNYFSIIFDNVTNGFTNGVEERGVYNDWVYRLYTGSEKNDNNLIANGDITSDNLQVMKTNILIEGSSSNEYYLEIEYLNLNDVNQSADMGANLSLRVNIYLSGYENNFEEGLLTYDILNNAIKNKSNTSFLNEELIGITGTNTTFPGKNASLENEYVISTTEDDYGISYYYRGNVTDNYVNFAGMCFRIVRIQGDGSVKLALADEFNECDDSENNDKNNNGTYYSIDNNTSAFINNATAYKYSTGKTTDSLIYETSNIPTVLNEWAVSKGLAIKDSEGNLLFNDNIIETGWCNDMSIARHVYYDLNGNVVSEKQDDGIVNYVYGSLDRLYDLNSSNVLANSHPTLKCEFNGMNDLAGNATVSRKFVNFIGMLTADELVFSGSTPYLSNTTYNYFLKTNSFGYYWTISPYDNFVGLEMPRLWGMGQYGGLVSDPVFYDDVVRPSIVLKSSVKALTNSDTATYGLPGTQTNPYVIS